jgi:hypothetical protein
VKRFTTGAGGAGSRRLATPLATDLQRPLPQKMPVATDNAGLEE